MFSDYGLSQFTSVDTLHFHLVDKYYYCLLKQPNTRTKLFGNENLVMYKHFVFSVCVV